MIANENDHLPTVSAKVLSTRSAADVPQLCEQLVGSIASGDMTAYEISQLIWLRMLRQLHGTDFDAQYAVSTFRMMGYFLEKRHIAEFRNVASPICESMDRYELLETAEEICKISKIHSPILERAFQSILARRADQIIAEPQAQAVFPQYSHLVDTLPASIGGRRLSLRERNDIIEHINRVVELVPTTFTDRLHALLASLWGKISTESGLQEVRFLCTEIERLSTGQTVDINGKVHQPGWTRAKDTTKDILPEEEEIIRYKPVENNSQHERCIGTHSGVLVPAFDLFARPPLLSMHQETNVEREIPQYRRAFSSVNEWRKVRP
ncbi:asnC family transcriptional regulator [Perkinsela sp. CCAP 1560/4]|nr:asnC family transcriptional regulator [Perkinsela sp. CCAP 1560/4]|eukprot:KNH05119.1 asnC family transcriptional regulator [Perkinsela sp. CCAP 1560/4]